MMKMTTQEYLDFMKERDELTAENKRLKEFKASDDQVKAWSERHDLRMSLGDARQAFDDAASTLYL